MWEKVQRIIQLVILAVTVVLMIKNFGKQGKFLGVPYDFTMPTPEKIMSRWWNPSDHEIFKPHVFGWGYSINLGAIAARLGLV